MTTKPIFLMGLQHVRQRTANICPNQQSYWSLVSARVLTGILDEAQETLVFHRQLIHPLGETLHILG